MLSYWQKYKVFGPKTQLSQLCILVEIQKRDKVEWGQKYWDITPVFLHAKAKQKNFKVRSSVLEKYKNLIQETLIIRICSSQNRS